VLIKRFAKGAVGLLMLLLLTVSVGAEGATDRYYYPGYNVEKSGYVDLMSYMTQVEVGVNGQRYTQAQLEKLEKAGTPLTLELGDPISFHFRFSLCGRAYADDDQTLLVEEDSTWVTYSHATTALNGIETGAGERGILDDSSLMLNTTAEDTILRMDIEWLQELCSDDFEISYTDGSVSFQQGRGKDRNYLYVYFPDGIGEDVYADEGFFTIQVDVLEETDSIDIPGSEGFYTPGSEGWSLPVRVRHTSHTNHSGTITAYGDITVEKVWITDEEIPDAVIVLDYVSDGQAQEARRTVKKGGDAVFTIRHGMTNCVLTEDMSDLPNYRSALAQSEDGLTFTFTNTLVKDMGIQKTDEKGQPLAGAKLALYRVTDQGKELIDEWVSDAQAHMVPMIPGQYLLREKKAPVGYAAADVEFTISNSYQFSSKSNKLTLQGDEIRLRNDPLYVKLAKTDAAGKALAGAQLQLLDLNTGEVVDSWTSADEPHAITFESDSGIRFNAMHRYRFEELSAPYGYRLADPIDFQFNADGTINGCPYRTVTMVDERRTGGGEGISASGDGPGLNPDDPYDPDAPNNPNAPEVPNNPDTPDGPDSPDDYGGTGIPGVPGGTDDTNGGAGDGTSDDGKPPRVQTGDSPFMWLMLALGVVFLGAAAVMLYMILVLRRQYGRNRGDER